MTKLPRSPVAGLCLLVLGALLTSVYLSRPLFTDTLDPAMATGVSMAPVDQALTLARYREQGRPRVLLVRGYDTVAEAAGGAPVTVDVAKLEVPFERREAHIGIGASYPEHALESHVAKKPFVCPKRALCRSRCRLRRTQGRGAAAGR